MAERNLAGTGHLIETTSPEEVVARKSDLEISLRANDPNVTRSMDPVQNGLSLNKALTQFTATEERGNADVARMFVQEANTMAGRKPLGPKLVGHLEGSTRAKERLEVILETIAGRLTIVEACERLGIKEAMFHRLRSGVLEAGLAHLEPRPPGRPRRTSQPALQRQLESQVQELKDELEIAHVRWEIAQVLPHVIHPPDGDSDAPKKTNVANQKRNRSHRQKKRKNRKPR